MLLLRGMCAGKGVLRVSDLVERGGTRLLLSVLSILDAGAAESVTSRRLPLVLDEFFLLFSSIVRYEAELEPLLARLAALLLRLLHLGGSAAAYIQGHAGLLRRLATWYMHLPDLTAILEFLDPHSEVLPPVSVSVMAVDAEASQLEHVAARLRMARHVPLGRLEGVAGEGAPGALALEPMDVEPNAVEPNAVSSDELRRAGGGEEGSSMLLSTLREAEVCCAAVLRQHAACEGEGSEARQLSEARLLSQSRREEGKGLGKRVQV